jgi:hypothetical protein
MLVYSLWVIAVNGAVPPAALVNQSGTVLTPLAGELGPVAYIIGLVFVILGMGMSSIHYGLALFNQTREWLPQLASPSESRGIVRAMVSDRSGRFVIGAAPVVAIFGVSEWLLLTRQQSFVGPLGFLGVFAVPALAGIFPILMLAASRRKGEYVPGMVLDFLGHPLVLVCLYLFFVAGVFAHGLVIWQNPAERLAALLVVGIFVLLTFTALRRGSFTPRHVVEVRVDRGDGDRAVFNVTATGQTIPSDVWLEYVPGEQRVAAVGGEAREFAHLHSATFRLAQTRARELKAWVHQVMLDGESEALPARLEIRSGRFDQKRDLRRFDGQVLVPLDGCECEVQITFSSPLRS